MSATARPGDTAALREIILGHLHPRVGKTAGDLMTDVRGDFGTVDDRRFYRQILWLIQVGCVRRAKDTMANWDRVDSANDGRAPLLNFYYLVHDRLPGTRRRSICKLCGLVGTRTASHPHTRFRQDLSQLASASKRAAAAAARAERAARGVEIAKRRVAADRRRLDRSLELLKAAEARAELAATRAKRARKLARRAVDAGGGTPIFVPVRPRKRPADQPASGVDLEARAAG